MWNHSKTFILFQWEKLKSSYHTMVVEPPTGRIGALLFNIYSHGKVEFPPFFYLFFLFKLISFIFFVQRRTNALILISFCLEGNQRS